MNLGLSGTPLRKQRADRLALLLLWADAGLEIRQAFGGSFARFETYAVSEAEQLIRSAGNTEEKAEGCLGDKEK